MDSTADSTHQATASGQAQAPEPDLAIRHERMGPNPLLGLGLAVLVGVAVFWALLRIRRAFGMK